MGLFGFLKGLFPSNLTNTSETLRQDGSSQISSSKGISTSDKEFITVNRVTAEDMQQLSSLPFHWNCEVQKFIKPHGHSFAFIDLIEDNIDIAKCELENMNLHIKKAHHLCSRVPARISIPVNKVVFTPSETNGYTRLICTPHTFTGQPSLYPASLSFMTDLSSNVASTHGKLFYGHDGTVKKAEIYFWRNKVGYFLYYTTIDDEFILERIEYTGEPTEYMRPIVIYKAPHILEIEARRAQEEQDFLWIQENLPGECPKSLSGFRRMKTQNTKNYQLLKQLAAERGREI